PFIPDIFGVNVLCFSSPSFLNIRISKNSNMNGNIEISITVTNIPISFVLYIAEFIDKYIKEIISESSIKLLLKLSNILYLDNIFSFLFFSHFIICQSPLIHLDSLFMKLLYFVGYPSINITSETSPHLK